MLTAAALGVTVGGCKSPTQYRREADKVAYEIVREGQEAALGRTEPFTIDRPSDTLRRRLLREQDLPRSTPASLGSRSMPLIPQWPDDAYFQDEVALGPPPWSGEPPLRITLLDALRIGARNSREYQLQKELVFQAALALDLERDEFRNTFFGFLESAAVADLSPADDVAGFENTARFDLARRLQSGAAFAVGIGVDLAKLLTMDQSSSLGIFGDATVSIPLLRGSGRFVVTEPLRQAERDVIYAIYLFERFKRVFAVDVAADYLDVLAQLDVAANSEDNYRELIRFTRHARRRAEAGRLPEIQVDQARQDELEARNDWIVARQEYERRLDRFKARLGLPTDAAIELDVADLRRLAEWTEAGIGPQADEPVEVPPADAPVVLETPEHGAGGPLEMAPDKAVTLALGHRLDLRVQVGRIFDAQRTVAVAADNLRADLTLLGSAAVGDRRTLSSADLDDADLRFEDGTYTGLINLDLPLERTAERNLYRNSLIAMERAVRDTQELEDAVKFEVRDALRNLLEFRETVIIQKQQVELARQRVQSTRIFLQAGRAEIRDLLEAQEDLLDAQNAFSEALVAHRVAELALQRDLGLLRVNEEGLWTEYDPEAPEPADGAP